MRRHSGWYNEPRRHALAAKGIKSRRKSITHHKGRHMKLPFKSYKSKGKMRSDLLWMEKEMTAGREIQRPDSRPRREQEEDVDVTAQVVPQDVDFERQFQRDLGDEEFIEARYDLSDPESDASIDREAREELRADAEYEFWQEATSKYREGGEAFKKWLNEDVSKELQSEVIERLERSAHIDALVEEGWEWENGIGYVPPKKWEKYMKTDSKSVYAARRREGWSDADARNHVRRFAYWELDMKRAREDWPLPTTIGRSE